MYLNTLLTIIVTLSVVIKAAPISPPVVNVAAAQSNVSGQHNTATLYTTNAATATQGQNANVQLGLTTALDSKVVSASKGSSTDKNKLDSTVNLGASGGNSAKMASLPVETNSGSATAVKVSGNYNDATASTYNTANVNLSQGKTATVGLIYSDMSKAVVADAGSNANKNKIADTLNIGDSGSNNAKVKSTSIPVNAGLSASQVSGNNEKLTNTLNNNANLSSSQYLTSNVGVNTAKTATTVVADSGSNANKNKASSVVNVGSSVSNNLSSSAKHR